MVVTAPCVRLTKSWRMPASASKTPRPPLRRRASASRTPWRRSRGSRTSTLLAPSRASRTPAPRSKRPLRNWTGWVKSPRLAPRHPTPPSAPPSGCPPVGECSERSNAKRKAPNGLPEAGMDRRRDRHQQGSNGAHRGRDRRHRDPRRVLAGDRRRAHGRLQSVTGSPGRRSRKPAIEGCVHRLFGVVHDVWRTTLGRQDRKSTRLNSSHVSISYAVFCLKKKK